jgi:hypothetical protein
MPHDNDMWKEMRGLKPVPWHSGQLTFKSINVRSFNALVTTLTGDQSKH